MKPAKQGCSPQRSGGVEGSGDIRVSRRICVNMNIDRERESERERERILRRVRLSRVGFMAQGFRTLWLWGFRGDRV